MKKLMVFCSVFALVIMSSCDDSAENEIFDQKEFKSSKSSHGQTSGNDHGDGPG